jgi:hypothetical protein
MNAALALKGKAKQLGIAGYRTMSQDELKAAIDSAQGTKSVKSAPAKSAPKKGVAKVSSNGTKGKATATKAIKGVAKKSAPAKSTKPSTKGAKGTAKRQSTKRAPVKATHEWVPGSVGRRPLNITKAQLAEHERILAERRANRPRPVGNWQPGSRGRRPENITAAQLKEHERLIELAKQERAEQPKLARQERIAQLMKKGARKLTPKQLAEQGGFRVGIDHKAVDWKMETRVGNRGGKRADVMKALRRFNGNVDKVVDHLMANAKAWFPNYTKADYPKMMRWLVNRVAFDYAMDTEQHTPGQRAAYGTSKNPVAVARRQENAKAGRKPGRPKATGAAQKAAPAKGRVKATRKPAGAQKGRGRATKGRARK